MGRKSKTTLKTIQELLDSEIKQGMVGIIYQAHQGQLAKELAEKGAIVHAIEPFSYNFDILKTIPSIKAYRLALTNYDGEADLYIDCPSTVCTINKERLTDERFKDYYISDKSEKVPCMTLETFMKSNSIDKIDFFILNAEDTSELQDIVSYNPRILIIKDTFPETKIDKLLKNVGYVKVAETCLNKKENFFMKGYLLK